MGQASSPPLFSVEKEADFGAARLGRLTFDNGRRRVEVPTPQFMPVGTQATVKGLTQEDLEQIGYDLILANTYHLYLRPGSELIGERGGIKDFMAWSEHALLTDSGGYQVFSLNQNMKLLDHGVRFASHIDGSRHEFTPSKVVDLQVDFGSDIMMVLDDCAPADADRARLEQALERTHRWAEESIEHFTRRRDVGSLDARAQKIFGIIQGGTDPELRRRSAAAIQALPFDGIAIGGLSVGESRESFHATLETLAPELDRARVHYLMGVGTIPDFLEAIRCGVDIFDCVLPTRNARNGQLLTSAGKLNIRNARYAHDERPIDPECDCRLCRRYSRSYLRHLFASREMLGAQLASYHNLAFFYRFMSSLRQSIVADQFQSFYNHWKSIPY